MMRWVQQWVGTAQCPYELPLAGLLISVGTRRKMGCLQWRGPFIRRLLDGKLEIVLSDLLYCGVKEWILFLGAATVELLVASII